jgi:hypothetical protein
MDMDVLTCMVLACTDGWQIDNEPRKDENGLKRSKKTLNCFLLLHLKYENESKNGKSGHENERELTKY